MIAPVFPFSRVDSLANIEESRHLWSSLNCDLPTLVVNDVPKAFQLYENVFGFQRIFVLPDEQNHTIFARMRYRGTYFTILQDDDAQHDCQFLKAEKHQKTILYLYVDDVERVYLRAVANGFRSLHSLHSDFLGDRKARLLDVFGHIWDIAARI
jgi:PhnB protein